MPTPIFRPTTGVSYTPSEALSLIRMLLPTLSANALHEATGIVPSTYYRWRDGFVKQPRLETFLTLTNFFDISVIISPSNVNQWKNTYARK